MSVVIFLVGHVAFRPLLRPSASRGRGHSLRSESLWNWEVVLWIVNTHSGASAFSLVVKGPFAALTATLQPSSSRIRDLSLRSRHGKLVGLRGRLLRSRLRRPRRLGSICYLRGKRVRIEAVRCAQNNAASVLGLMDRNKAILTRQVTMLPLTKLEIHK